MLYSINHITLTPYNTLIAYLRICVFAIFILTPYKKTILFESNTSKFRYKVWDLYNLFKQKYKRNLILTMFSMFLFKYLKINKEKRSETSVSNNYISFCKL